MLNDNIALLTARIQATGVFDAVFVSKYLVEMKTAESSRSSTAFPLFLRDEGKPTQLAFASQGRKSNFAPQALQLLAQRLGVKRMGDFDLPEGIAPRDVLHYIYAIFHAPTYRARYAEFLKIDFPRVPLTGSSDLFRGLAALGGELVGLHLLESPALAQHITTYC